MMSWQDRVRAIVRDELRQHVDLIADEIGQTITDRVALLGRRGPCQSCGGCE